MNNTPNINSTGFYFLRIPSLVLLLELLDAVSNTFFLTVGMRFLASLVPDNVFGTFRGIQGAMQMGVGEAHSTFSKTDYLICTLSSSK